MQLGYTLYYKLVWTTVINMVKECNVGSISSSFVDNIGCFSILISVYQISCLPR